MKYKVGDSFLLRMTIDSVDDSGDSLPYCMGEEADGMWLSEEAIIELSEKAAAYAAKAAPAAWEPKRGERVLVEMEFVREEADGEVYVQKGDGNFIAVPRSAIVGPDPKRARFAVGDEAFRLSTMCTVRIHSSCPWLGDGKKWLIEKHPLNLWVDDSDLLTLDEARERLKK